LKCVVDVQSAPDLAGSAVYCRTNCSPGQLRRWWLG